MSSDDIKHAQDMLAEAHAELRKAGNPNFDVAIKLAKDALELLEPDQTWERIRANLVLARAYERLREWDAADKCWDLFRNLYGSKWNKEIQKLVNRYKANRNIEKAMTHEALNQYAAAGQCWDLSRDLYPEGWNKKQEGIRADYWARRHGI